MDGMIFRWKQEALPCEIYGKVLVGSIKENNLAVWIEYLPQMDKGVLVFEAEGLFFKLRGTGQELEGRLRREIELNSYCGNIESDWDNMEFWKKEEMRLLIAQAFFQRVVVE